MLPIKMDIYEFLLGKHEYPQVGDGIRVILITAPVTPHELKLGNRMKRIEL